jgi:prophage antirepressor-like protein
MNEIIKHPEFGEIRTVIRKGEPLFVANDVCLVLGLGNQHDSGVRNLDEDEKGRYKIPTPGGAQEMTVITESGLYALILRSRIPVAKQFRKWVTGEVLPSIRKHGFYVHPQMMSRKDEARLRRELAARIDRYLTEDDRRKIAKKFGHSVLSINQVIRGQETNNAIMQECQQRALANKEKELNAYQPERLREVLDILSR